ncbi:MAG TPA: hypothetical protein VEQ63_05470 [Bryobacteraceae bacterium]|nr:hypothetical protein [Bryobacteraceae bacterium]
MHRPQAADMQRYRTYLTWLVLPAVIVSFTSCTQDERPGARDRTLAEAFSGPIELPLRAEIAPTSKPVSTVKHGEKLQIIQVRRRFVRVRTSRGDVGWTDSRHLLTAEQMNKLGALAAEAKRMPSQGEAMVYTALNMHTDPSRQSTSFYQITEGMRVDVVAHRLTPRTNDPPPIFRIPKAAPRAVTKKKKEPKVPPPPRPAAPQLPPNWIALSKSTIPPPPPPPEPPPEAVKAGAKKRRRPKKEAPKVPMEDWYLVRTRDGKAGWILSRMSHLAIPDEVAQYSEGARITAYAALKEVQDGEEKKRHWIWTTIREGGEPYQFDSFRIFTWVVRKHRYETAYIERDVEGYYPLLAKPGAVPQFSLVTREEDGKLHQKTYVLEGYLVRKIRDEIYDPGRRTEPGDKVISQLGPEEPGESETTSLMDRVRGFFARKEGT